MKILDSSPVIAFYSELDKPDLLHKFIKLGYELRIPKEFFDKLKNREDNKLRLFNKEDYGYYRLGIGELEEIYPADSIKGYYY